MSDSERDSVEDINSEAINPMDLFDALEIVEAVEQLDQQAAGVSGAASSTAAPAQPAALDPNARCIRCKALVNEIQIICDHMFCNWFMAVWLPDSRACVICAAAILSEQVNTIVDVCSHSVHAPHTWLEKVNTRVSEFLKELITIVLSMAASRTDLGTTQENAGPFENHFRLLNVILNEIQTLIDHFM